jgi:membrane protein
MDQIAAGTGAAQQEPHSQPRTHTPAQPVTGWRQLAGMAETARAFIRQVYKKAEADNIFFMAGAISFNVIVAIVPLLLASLGIAGTVLQVRATDPTEPLIEYITRSLPPVGDEFINRVRDILRELIRQSAGLLSIGTILLIWFSTRLIGTLRTTLREVFDIPEGRSIIAGKIFDIKMVLAAGTLFAINVGITLALDIAVRYGIRILGLTPHQIGTVLLIYGQALAFVVIWLMFLLIYRYLPARKAQWRTALMAATFTAVLFEVMKRLFGWYATSIANYSSTYGSLSTLIILFFWIYYTAIIFILGGEIAQVAATRRIMRRQQERLQ